MAAPRKYTDEQYAAAEQLVSEGASIRDAANTTGIGYGSLYRRVKKPDPVPGGGGSAKRRTASTSRKGGATDEQLHSLFTKIAVAPAIPMGLMVHCEFCATHFATNGPNAAAQLVELSHDHPALRSVMENIWGYADEIAWAAVLGTWIGVPVAHHMAPDMIYRWLQIPMGLPPRGVPSHVHTPPPPSNGTPTPFADMDLESVMAMAKGMGIDFDIPPDALVTDPPTVATDEPTDTADEDTPVETVTADSDTGE